MLRLTILTCKSELGIQGQSEVRLLGHLTVFINTIEKDSNFGIDNLRKSAQGCTDLLGTLAQRINNGNQVKTRSVGINWFNFNLGMLVTMKLDFIPCLGLRPEIQSFELITHFLVPLALLDSYLDKSKELSFMAKSLRFSWSLFLNKVYSELTSFSPNCDMQYLSSRLKSSAANTSSGSRGPSKRPLIKTPF